MLFNLAWQSISYIMLNYNVIHVQLVLAMHIQVQESQIPVEANYLMFINYDNV